MNRDGILSFRDVLNYSFCRRIPYFEIVLKAPQATTIKEYRGRESHEDFLKKARRQIWTQQAPYTRVMYEVNLGSDKLNFQTRLDCILFDDKSRTACPVQVKDSAKPPFLYRGMKLQIAGEAVLIEEKLNYSVSSGSIRFLRDGEVVDLIIANEQKQEFISVLNELNTALLKEELPEPTPYFKRCIDCCLKNVCRRV